MRTNITAVCAAIASIVIGVLILLEPRYYSGRYKRYVDFGDFREITALVFIIGGIIAVCLTWRNESAARSSGFVICPKCESTSVAGVPEKSICPECKVPLEELRGFYERHKIAGDK